MVSVAVNAPKTPVTEGSMDMAPATMPNICKMPGPPAPFIPTPLPNLGRSADRLDEATSTVKIDGKKIAIKGSFYMSQPSPDVASKGTGGGIVSAATQGTTKFVAPGSMNVKAEGKNIQLLGDAMSNNGGSPANSATMPGNQQQPKTAMASELECGESGSWGKLSKKKARPKWERDHIPSQGAMLRAAKNLKKMKPGQIACVKRKLKRQGMCITIPKPDHRGFSRTCGGRNTDQQMEDDAKDLKKAVDKDTKKMQKHLNKTNRKCAKAYKEATKKIKEHDVDKMILTAVKECTS
jgi:uncharacterized Zn-binding protein involved in type VI secretion